MKALAYEKKSDYNLSYTEFILYRCFQQEEYCMGEKTKRTIEELNIIDDFLFLEMINYGEEGKEFCRLLLSTILNRPIGKVKVTAQKVITPGSTTNHGVRLDVCIEEITCKSENMGANGNICGNKNTINAEVANHVQDIYDVEMENRKSTEIRKSLPKRSRYYHSMIDRNALQTGADYKELKNVYVILIMPEDPFDRNRMWYTAKTQIVEDVTISYEDGATTIYLYTKGKMEKDRKELAELLYYIEDSKEDNVSNSTVAKIHKFTEQVKKDKEVGIGYMKTIEYENFIREEAREEVRAEVKEEVRAEIREEAIDSCIQICMKVNLSEEETLQNIMEQFQLTKQNAKVMMGKYWK